MQKECIMTFQPSVELTILTGCRGALEMDEEEEVGNFVGRLCAGFRLACGCIPRQKMRSATSGNINFLNYGTNKKIDNKFSKIGKIKKMLWNSYSTSFLHLILIFFSK